ncbi:hypothetical protein OIU78_024984 [Salix suchowensis]|nr:hypothetical protein OIU78_024984 [Salix suchowensis]
MVGGKSKYTIIVSIMHRHVFFSLLSIILESKEKPPRGEAKTTMLYLRWSWNEFLNFQYKKDILSLSLSSFSLDNN